MHLLTPKTPAWQQLVYYLVQLSLIFGISYTLGPRRLQGLPPKPGGNAAEYLGNPWQWAINLGVLGSFTFAIYSWTSDLGSSLTSALTYSPAIFFIVIYTDLQRKEKAALHKSEALNRELEGANAKLAAFAAQAEDMAITQERNRLAREIHDTLGHYLTVVNVQIEAARAVMGNNPAKAMGSLSTAQELTQKGLDAVRQSVSALRESPLGGRTLAEAIHVLVDDSQRSGLVTLFEVVGAPRPLGAKAELTLYRAAQESLTNVRKHARASRVDLFLDFGSSQSVRLKVEDNGVGAVVVEDGFGLLGLRERTKLLGGSLEVESTPGQGFTLTLAMPTPAQEGTA